VLGPHLDRLPPEQHAAFVHEVASRMPEPVIDYVRLNIVARRSSR
jgi:trans-aconitate 2-methyltransferase